MSLFSNLTSTKNNHSTPRINEMVDNAYALYQLANNEYFEDSTGFNSLQDVDMDIKVEYYRTILFNFDYYLDTSIQLPYVGDIKKHLETSIINYYLMYQIADETTGLFKHQLKTKMRLITPRFNEIFRSLTFDYEPLYNVDYTETYEKINDDVRNQSANSNLTTVQDETQNASNDNFGSSSNTPNTQINVSDFLDNHASSVEKSKNSATSDTVINSEQQQNQTTNDKSDKKENYNFHRIGNYGVKSSQALLLEFRETLIDVEQMYIDELKNIFNPYFGFID